MPRLRLIAFLLMVLPAAPLLLSGCSMLLGWCHLTKTEEPAPTPPPKSDYEKLSEKAEQGDSDAARKLAQWCYVHDADNERAKYWLQVAARNGDKGAEKIAEVVQDWR